MKISIVIFCIVVVVAAGLSIHGIDEKRRVDQQIEQTWTARFWEKEKNSLVRGELKAFLKLPIADKIELMQWLENRFRKEELSNQNREEKLHLRMAIASIVIDAENRTHYAKFKDLSRDGQASFLAELGADEARMFRQWMKDEMQRISNEPIVE